MLIFNPMFVHHKADAPLCFSQSYDVKEIDQDGLCNVFMSYDCRAVVHLNVFVL